MAKKLIRLIERHPTADTATGRRAILALMVLDQKSAYQSPALIASCKADLAAFLAAQDET